MTQPTTAYPVRVDARLDARLSRWLWLVKWLLAIPHFIVLWFLWVTFVVLSVIAFFAILFTGRYPRGIFDFNVGVLRWSWRVAYYSYAVLGTDRYPPFTLAEVPDYPATFQVDYPRELSRGLVLVKWWLLAIPHYLVVGFFLGGGGYYGWRWIDSNVIAGAGLITLLVFFAAVVLLFTARYPHSVFDFVLGMNRWVLRVTAYAGLMTDAYPPLRLDQGGADPSTAERDAVEGDAVEGDAVEGAATPPPPGKASAGGVVLAVVGALLILMGTAAATVGAIGVGYGSDRDDDGFVYTRTARFSTDTYALRFDTADVRWASPLRGSPREVRILVDSQRPVFVGIGRVADVTGYLSGVAHDRVTDIGRYPSRASVQRQPGDRAPQPPATQPFWVSSVTGAGDRSLTWTVQEGQWSVVVLNAGGNGGVDARLAAGVRPAGLLGVGAWALVAGVVAVVAGALLMFAGLRRQTSGPQASGSQTSWP